MKRKPVFKIEEFHTPREHPILFNIIQEFYYSKKNFIVRLLTVPPPHTPAIKEKRQNKKKTKK